MSTAMVIGLFILILGVLLSPGAVLLFFVCAIGYVIYLCTTPTKEIISRDIVKRKRKEENQKSKLSDDDIQEFINGGSYYRFTDEVVFTIIREYRNKLLDVLNSNDKIKVNTLGIKKVFGYDITDDEEFIEYLKSLYIRRYIYHVKFSWFDKKERIALSRLDLLKKYDYYEDIRKRWDKAHKGIYIILFSMSFKDCWDGLPEGKENYWFYLNKGKV